jgi:hypothetical protein
MESLNGLNRVVHFHKDRPTIGRAQRYDLIRFSRDAGNHGAQGRAVTHILTEVYFQFGDDQTDVVEYAEDFHIAFLNFGLGGLEIAVD